jgi:hypothetical protein
MNSFNVQSCQIIAYACVSSAAQCSSLAEQELKIEQYMGELNMEYLMVLPAIQSRKNGMDDNLIDTINKCNRKKNKKEILLVVTSFDRITRNMCDLDYLMHNVPRIYAINTGILHAPNEYFELIQTAQTEIQIISERAKNRSKKINPKKESPCQKELIRRARIRVANAWTAIQMNPTNEMSQIEHSNVQQYMTYTQTLCGTMSWLRLSLLSKDMGGSNIMKDYVDAAESNDEFRLTKADALYYANEFKCFSCVCDNLTKEYLNASFELAKRTELEKEEAEDEKEVEVEVEEEEAEAIF